MISSRCSRNARLARNERLFEEVTADLLKSGSLQSMHKSEQLIRLFQQLSTATGYIVAPCSTPGIDSSVSSLPVGSLQPSSVSPVWHWPPPSDSSVPAFEWFSLLSHRSGSFNIDIHKLIRLLQPSCWCLNNLICRIIPTSLLHHDYSRRPRNWGHERQAIPGWNEVVEEKENPSPKTNHKCSECNRRDWVQSRLTRCRKRIGWTTSRAAPWGQQSVWKL